MVLGKLIIIIIAGEFAVENVDRIKFSSSLFGNLPIREAKKNVMSLHRLLTDVE
jgi:hypothetical protein